MIITITAPTLITAEFLTQMLAKNSGQIASSGRLFSNQKMSVYAAIKWSLNRWSNNLRHEMVQSKKN